MTDERPLTCPRCGDDQVFKSDRPDVWTCRKRHEWKEAQEDVQYVRTLERELEKTRDQLYSEAIEEFGHDEGRGVFNDWINERPRLERELAEARRLQVLAEERERKQANRANGYLSQVLTSKNELQSLRDRLAAVTDQRDNARRQLAYLKLPSVTQEGVDWGCGDGPDYVLEKMRSLWPEDYNTPPENDDES